MTSTLPPRAAVRAGTPEVGPTGMTYALLSAVAAAAGAVALLSALALAPTALHGAGTPAMTAALLALVGLAATCLCGYLALIWALAALARGRHGTLSGRAGLRVLRLLAPALARRVALGAATATAVGSLALGPALAMDPSSWDEPSSTPVAAAQPMGTAVPGLPMAEPLPDTTHPSHMARAMATAELAPAPADGDAVPRDSPDDSPAPAGDAPAAPGDAPPRLGWVAPAPASEAPAPQQRTVTVRPGDSLWSLSDDLLGPDDEPAAEIAAVWPELYRANATTIGADPDLIHPGQVLVVPAGIGEGASGPDQPAPSPHDTAQQETS